MQLSFLGHEWRHLIRVFHCGFRKKRFNITDHIFPDFSFAVFQKLHKNAHKFRCLTNKQYYYQIRERNEEAVFSQKPHTFIYLN